MQRPDSWIYESHHLFCNSGIVFSMMCSHEISVFDLHEISWLFVGRQLLTFLSELKLCIRQVNQAVSSIHDLFM